MGAQPYPSYNNGEMVQLLQSGYRMPPVQDCPEALYKVMATCWQFKPKVCSCIYHFTCDNDRIAQRLHNCDKSCKDSQMCLTRTWRRYVAQATVSYPLPRCQHRSLEMITLPLWYGPVRTTTCSL